MGRFRYVGPPSVREWCWFVAALPAYFETELVYRVDQYAQVIGIDRRVDAVSKIEDMAVVVAETGDDILRSGANAVGIGIEHTGIHVAL